MTLHSEPKRLLLEWIENNPDVELRGDARKKNYLIYKRYNN